MDPVSQVFKRVLDRRFVSKPTSYDVPIHQSLGGGGRGGARGRALDRGKGVEGRGFARHRETDAGLAEGRAAQVNLGSLGWPRSVFPTETELRLTAFKLCFQCYLRRCAKAAQASCNLRSFGRAPEVVVYVRGGGDGGGGDSGSSGRGGSLGQAEADVLRQAGMRVLPSGALDSLQPHEVGRAA